MVVARILFPEEVSLTISTHFSADEAIGRLRALTRSKMGPFSPPGLYGRFYGSTVQLWRVGITGNALRPYFRGAFTDREDGSVLRGRLGPEGIGPAFMLFWSYAVIALSTVATSVGVYAVFQGAPFWAPLVFASGGIGLIGFAALFCRALHAQGSMDRRMIADAIGKALN